MTKDTFPTRGSRLDAAPTELIACCSPVTIKILLLRSIAGPTNVQTPGTGVLARQIVENGFQMSKLQGRHSVAVKLFQLQLKRVDYEYEEEDDKTGGRAPLSAR
jgi:hypothetical protein